MCSRIARLACCLIALSACAAEPAPIILETPVPSSTPAPRATHTPSVTAASSPRATANPEVPAVKININIADEETLASLPRIGQVIARRIIAYRQANGLFQSIDELKNVSGIGEVTFNAIRDRITVGD